MAIRTHSAGTANMQPMHGRRAAAEDRRTDALESFAEALRRELAPATQLEALLADRVALAAWRLMRLVREGFADARLDEGVPPDALDVRDAEYDLRQALRSLEAARKAGRECPTIEAPGRDDDAWDHLPNLSNEWPTLPLDPETLSIEPETGDSDDDDRSDDRSQPMDHGLPRRWQDRLVFDPEISERSPVVRGTWVTVGQVVSRVVDGWTWSDILRTHPELTEDDIRTCLAYTAELDDQGTY